MDLNNAEIAVTTQHLMDIKDYRDYWLHLSDYSDMSEFLCACSDLFPGKGTGIPVSQMGEHPGHADQP